MRCHGPGTAQRSVHHLPMQRLIWPGLPVLVQLVWQVARGPSALIVDILLACTQNFLFFPAKCACLGCSASTCLVPGLDLMTNKPNLSVRMPLASNNSVPQAGLIVSKGLLIHPLPS